MSYSSQDQLTQNPIFQGKVRQGIVRYAANDVLPEAEATPFHEQRLALARAVLADPHGKAQLMAHLVASDDSFTEAVTDGALFAKIAAVWNEYAAGVP